MSIKENGKRLTDSIDVCEEFILDRSTNKQCHVVIVAMALMKEDDMSSCSHVQYICQCVHAIAHRLYGSHLLDLTVTLV